MPTPSRPARAVTSPLRGGDGWTDRVAVHLVQAMIVGGTVIFWPSAPIGGSALLKATWVAVCAVLLLVVVAIKVIDRRQIRIPVDRPVLLGGAFSAVMVGLALFSGNMWRSLAGQLERQTGALPYLLFVVVLVLIASELNEDDVDGVLMAFIGSAAFVAGYALLQRLGLDPVDQRSAYSDRATISTLGNANFVAGYLAIAAPLLVWAAARWRERPRLRLAVIAAGAIVALAIVATQSLQGPVAAATGVTVVVFGIRGSSATSRRRWPWLVAGAALALGLTLFVAGLAGSGPLGASLNDVGRTQRLQFWSAAFDIFKDHPIVGVGPDRFVEYYRAYRPASAALAFGVAESADAPHNVPLGMLTSGGLLLGAAYLAFIVAVGLTLLRGMRRSEGERRLLLFALGGAWLSYQTQSLVSIDAPPLSLLHFVLAGLIVVTADDRSWRVFDLRGRAAVNARARRQRGSRAGARSPVTWPAVIATGVAALAALVVVTTPARAELLAIRANQAAGRGDGNAAVDRMEAAHRALPWEPRFEAEIGRMFLSGDRPDLALPHYRAAWRREPRSLPYLLPYARLANASGDVQTAVSLYERAVVLEPNAPEVKVEAAKFHLTRGALGVAEGLIRDALDARPGDRDARLVEADLLYKQGDAPAADAVYAALVAESPDDYQLVQALGDVYMNRGEPAAALPYYRQLVELGASFERLTKLGDALAATGQTTAAIEAYTRAAILNKSYGPALDGLKKLGASPPP